MDDRAKIRLSAYEMELLNNPEWILTKNAIVKKARLLLEEVQQNIFGYVTKDLTVLPPEVRTISPKISKGENYLGLPWMILDFPRFFDKENIFAIRTMFWWGHFFSITLHLSGKYKQQFGPALANAYHSLCENDFYTCVHQEQWHHHFGAENYVRVKEFTAQEFRRQVQERPFIKLSGKIQFSQWNSVPDLLSETFTRIVKWMD